MPDDVSAVHGQLLGQADDCEQLGSALSAGLLRTCAGDLLAGGPTAGLLLPHSGLRARDALPLRLLGGVHALVLARQAPELATFYPSVGGTADAGPDALAARPALLDLLAARSNDLRPWLDHPPQTNEVGRGSALLGALRLLTSRADLPVRLVEMGASAGLTVRAEGFAVDGPAGAYGEPDSPVRLVGAWDGEPLPDGPPLRVLSREAGDLSPVDPTTTDGRLRLTAYVWADQTERLARLRGAFALVDRLPVALHREPAIATVGRWRPVEGTLGVLWQSVFEQYLPAADRDALEARIREAGAAATDTAPLARVSFEPEPEHDAGCVVAVTTWPGGHRHVVGTGLPHGVPVTWSGLTSWQSSVTVNG